MGLAPVIEVSEGMVSIWHGVGSVGGALAT